MKNIKTVKSLFLVIWVANVRARPLLEGCFLSVCCLKIQTSKGQVFVGVNKEKIHMPMW